MNMSATYASFTVDYEKSLFPLVRRACFPSPGFHEAIFPVLDTHDRLDYQPLFGKGARASPPNPLFVSFRGGT